MLTARWERTSRIPDVGQLAVVLGLLISLAYVLLRHYSGPVLASCPWKAALGFPCTFCGTTTTVALLLTGQPGPALACNPLVALLYSIWLGAALVVLLRVASGLRLRIQLARPVQVVLLVLFLAALAGNWIYVGVSLGS